MNILTMGVSGCGKSTIGSRIAAHFNLPFVEGDDYHPAANVAKMAAGQPLNDVDRQPWLEALGVVLAKAEGSNEAKGSVVACSALKAHYRQTLEARLKEELLVVWLDGSREVLLRRLNARKDHFFPTQLLDSQLATLEPPRDGIRIDIDQPIEQILEEAIKALSGS